MACGGKVRQQVVVEFAAQEFRGLVEDATIHRAAADAGDDAGERPVQAAQPVCQHRALAVAGDRAGQGAQVRAVMPALQRFQRGNVAGNRNHWVAPVDDGLDDAAADVAGGTDDGDHAAHCPAPGILSPA